MLGRSLVRAGKRGGGDNFARNIYIPEQSTLVEVNLPESCLCIHWVKLAGKNKLTPKKYQNPREEGGVGFLVHVCFPVFIHT